jgi:hypothetical protein
MMNPTDFCHGNSLLFWILNKQKLFIEARNKALLPNLHWYTDQLRDFIFSLPIPEHNNIRDSDSNIYTGLTPVKQ